jgi:hypothetical protein
MYSASNNLNYLFTFGGASVNYLNTVYPYNLLYDPTAPFSDVISVMVGSGNSYTQYYQDAPYTPEGNIIIESTPVYLPQAYFTGSKFYVMNDGSIPLYPNGQVNLDLLLNQNSTKQQILLGYIYGGMISTSNDAFIPESTGFGISKASNNLYKVYMNLNQSNWKSMN